MPPAKHSLASCPKRRVDSAMEIAALYTENPASFSLVVGTLSGKHGRFINEGGDRAYFILEGSGVVLLDTSRIAVEKGDLVPIPKGVSHGIEGELQVLILDVPPFAPDQEKRAAPIA